MDTEIILALILATVFAVALITLGAVGLYMSRRTDSDRIRSALQTATDFPAARSAVDAMQDGPEKSALQTVLLATLNAIIRIIPGQQPPQPNLDDWN